MQVDLKFNIKDKVRILALEDLKGRIVSIWILDNCIKYEVRYFYNCDKKEVYFYEDEIELCK